MRLAGKVAIVTGAASGFGAAIAGTFAREGASVLAVDISPRGAGTAVAIAAEHGGTVRFHQADVADDRSVAAMVRTAEDAFGGLDILVNNAGVTHANKSLLDVSEDEFDRIFAVNVKALFLAARHGVPALERRGGGVILTTASTAALRPRPGLTWYNASKGAAVTATKSMAAELAPRNIRVNALCPVITPTGMLEQFMGGPDTPETRARFVATIPLGRMGTPEDIANAALYLASDEAAFITGVALEVDGGRCI